MTKYRIIPDGLTPRRHPKSAAVEHVPEYKVQRASRDWLFFIIPVTDWNTIEWTTKPEEFEEIIKRDALKRARDDEHNATPTRYARTTLYLKSLSEPTPLQAVVHHLES